MIYFIRAGTDGPVKIGVSGNHTRFRLSSMQSGNHETLSVLGEMPGGEEQEKQLHQRFSALRIYRHYQRARRPDIATEWFKPSQELLTFIALLPRADHDGIGRKVKRAA